MAGFVTALMMCGLAGCSAETSVRKNSSSVVKCFLDAAAKATNVPPLIGEPRELEATRVWIIEGGGPRGYAVLLTQQGILTRGEAFRLTLRYDQADEGDRGASLWCDSIGVYVGYRAERLTVPLDWHSLFEQAREMALEDRTHPRTASVYDDTVVVVEASVAGAYAVSTFFSSERTASDADRKAESLRSSIVNRLVTGASDSGTAR